MNANGINTMLSPPDAELAQRDPAIAGLGTILDPAAFAAELQNAWPLADITSAQCHYIRYKPGTSCLASFRVEAAGGAVDVYAKAYGGSAQKMPANVRRRPAVPGQLGAGRILLEDCALAISVFPNDARLKSLGRLADPRRRRQLVRELVPNQPKFHRGAIHLLHYKPERRYVCQLRGRGNVRGVLKVYSKTEYRPRTGGTFESRGPLRVARQLGRLDRRSVLMFEWLDGQLLSELVSTGQLPLDGVALVGAALAELHAQTGPRLPTLHREMEVESLARVASHIAYLCPHLARCVERFSQRIAARIVDLPAIDLPCHGDFHAKQVLLTGDAAAIIDFDEAVRGDPAADLGNFIAHLHCAAMRGIMPAENVEPVAEMLLEGYRRAAGKARLDSVALYIAICLLRIAPHSFRQRDPDWPERTTAIVERAAAILETAPSNTFKAPLRRPLPRARPGDSAGVRVIDRFNIATDPAMPFLALALEPIEVQRQLETFVPRFVEEIGSVALHAIRVVRYKPRRRCLIEYEFRPNRASPTLETISLVGKAHAKGLDQRAYDLHASLRDSGFCDDSDDGISVPEPIGIIPTLQMWLQRKVPGIAATHLLPLPDGAAVARRIAESIHKLHSANVPAQRCHTMADELQILHAKLPLVAQSNPEWSTRIERILEACDRLGAATGETKIRRGIHRDFYPDQVLVDGPRTYLVDFDLYCAGDPALDVGNFLGHVIEQSLRTQGSPVAMRDQVESLKERFLELSGEMTRAAVRAYTILTLVRHIYLSTQFPQRRPFTEPLLMYCEQRLFSLVKS